MKGKNIVLFINGTGNALGPNADPKNTNVQKLHESAEADTDAQICKILPGIGTKGIDTILGTLPRPISNGIDRTFGIGISAQIRKAYEFLAVNYQPGDRIFLFGFSRGALAARSLAGFVSNVGLLLKEYSHPGQGHVFEAYRLYEKGLNAQQSSLGDYLQDLTKERRASTERENILPVHFIGVWDTVAALGMSDWFCDAASAPYTRHHEVEVPEFITHVRHALALHELRRVFKPLCFPRCNPKKTGQTLAQVWFAGAHADVGGGYPEPGWSNIALRWMTEEARAAGLRLKPERAQPPPRSLTESLHHQLRGAFALATPTARSHLLAIRKIDDELLKTFFVHESVCERLATTSIAYRYRRARIGETMSQIDELSVKLQLDLSVRLGNSPLDGVHTVKCSDAPMPTPSSEGYWWDEVTAGQLRTATTDVRDFLSPHYPEKAPTEEDQERLYRSLRIVLLFATPKFAADISLSLRISQEKYKEFDTSIENAELASRFKDVDCPKFYIFAFAWSRAWDTPPETVKARWDPMNMWIREESAWTRAVEGKIINRYGVGPVTLFPRFVPKPAGT
jgi:uncharacterized protein (DUF2235 family)